MAAKKKATKKTTRTSRMAKKPAPRGDSYRVSRLVAQKAVLGGQLREVQAKIAKINAELARNGALDHVLLW